MSPCFASSRDSAGWELVDTTRLPRHAFHCMIAFAGAEKGEATETLARLVSLRNALTPTGSLLVFLGLADMASDLRELAARAGFTRIRELARTAPAFSTIELKR